MVGILYEQKKGNANVKLHLNISNLTSGCVLEN